MITDVDLEELKNVIMGDIPESQHNSFNFDEIVKNCIVDDDIILVEVGDILLCYNSFTLDLVNGLGI